MPADRVPPEIAERFVDPPVEDMSAFSETRYNLLVSRPRDEFDEAPKEADEAWVAWVGLTRELIKPNGVRYSSPVTYTVNSENNARLYHLERHTDLEKDVPDRIKQDALMLHLTGASDGEDDLLINEISKRMAEYTKVYEGLEDPFDEDLLEEVAKLQNADIAHELGFDRIGPRRSLSDLAEADDTAKEYGLKDVMYTEADAVLKLLRSLDLFDQS
jgi:hypothetical protein